MSRSDFGEFSLPTAEFHSTWTVTSHAPEETAELGKVLGECCAPGTVLALIGNLGAGKTKFVQGLAEGLGVNSLLVNSPTYTLIQEYEGRLSIAHFDVYRLRSAEEFLELGAEEYLHGNGVSLVEWGDRVEGLLPEDRLEVRIEFLTDTERQLGFKSMGRISEELLKGLKSNWLLEDGAPGGGFHE